MLIMIWLLSPMQEYTLIKMEVMELPPSMQELKGNKVKQNAMYVGNKKRDMQEPSCIKMSARTMMTLNAARPCNPADYAEACSIATHSTTSQRVESRTSTSSRGAHRCTCSLRLSVPRPCMAKPTAGCCPTTRRAQMCGMVATAPTSLTR